MDGEGQGWMVVGEFTDYWIFQVKDSGKWGGIWELMSAGLDDRLHNVGEGKSVGWSIYLSREHWRTLWAEVMFWMYRILSTDTVTLRWLTGAQKEKSDKGSQSMDEMVRKQENCWEKAMDECCCCCYRMPGGWGRPGGIMEAQGRDSISSQWSGQDRKKDEPERTGLWFPGLEMTGTSVGELYVRWGRLQSVRGQGTESEITDTAPEKRAGKWDSLSKEMWRGGFETFFKKWNRLLTYLKIYLGISCERNKKRLEWCFQSFIFVSLKYIFLSWTWRSLWFSDGFPRPCLTQALVKGDQSFVFLSLR